MLLQLLLLLALEVSVVRNISMLSRVEGMFLGCRSACWSASILKFSKHVKEISMRVLSLRHEFYMGRYIGNQCFQRPREDILLLASGG